MFYRNRTSALAAALAFALFFTVAAPAVAKRLPTKPINLNTATLAQLEQLPDVGPGMAHRILAFRQKSGPFERVHDLLAIRGIGPRRFQKIRPYVFVKSSPSKPKRK
jgi:competence ComEA-like helix-hairpin-helix protein